MEDTEPTPAPEVIHLPSILVPHPRPTWLFVLSSDLSSLGHCRRAQETKTP